MRAWAWGGVILSPAYTEGVGVGRRDTLPACGWLSGHALSAPLMGWVWCGSEAVCRVGWGWRLGMLVKMSDNSQGQLVKGN